MIIAIIRVLSSLYQPEDVPLYGGCGGNYKN